MAFNTPSGGVSAEGRKEAKKAGETMPGTDKFPIRNKSDLAKAKHDIGRTSDPSKAKRWINKRAKELGAAPVGGEKPKRRRMGDLYKKD